MVGFWVGIPIQTVDLGVTWIPSLNLVCLLHLNYNDVHIMFLMLSLRFLTRSDTKQTV